MAGASDLIESVRLFDVSVDPSERRDLSSVRPQDARRLREREPVHRLHAAADRALELQSRKSPRAD